MDMQSSQTRLQPGQALSNLPAAVKETEEVQAFQRSPTLMAGETPGSQGNVRVWAPSRKTLMVSTAAFGVASLVLMALIILTRTGAAFSYLIGSVVVAFFLSARALRRPCYVTTDEAGIGITTSKSSLALRWEDIITAAIVDNRSNGMFNVGSTIKLTAPSPVEINLTGYSRRQENELFEMIKRRAELQPHPARPALFVNPQKLMPESMALSEPRNADIRKLAAKGDKIPAIKLYRDRFGTSLKDAKVTIDSLALNLELQSPHEVLAARIPNQELRRELLKLLRAGEKRAAIKLLQAQTGMRGYVALPTVNLLGSVAALPEVRPQEAGSASEGFSSEGRDTRNNDA